MALQHARDPHNLVDSDYGEFTLEIEQFLSDDRSQPHRPAHWVAEQAATGLAFRIALDGMNSALATRKYASDTIKNTVKSLKQKLSWMRQILPTLANAAILIPFGMDRDIPDKYAQVKDYGDTANTYWLTVRAQPLYAPVLAGCDELAGLLATYDSARATQIAADGEYGQRQNEKDTGRAAHHDCERRIFNWYVSYYPDAQDEYWEQTPWGKATGEPSVQFPAPVNLMFDQMRTMFSWQAVPQATKYELVVTDSESLEETTYTTASNKQSVELSQGDYSAKVRALRDSTPQEVSDWSVEIPVVIEFAAPGNLKYNPGQKEFSWDAVVSQTALLYQLVQQGAFEDIYLGTDTTFQHEVVGGGKFRIRAANDETSSWGEWSAWLAVSA